MTNSYFIIFIFSEGQIPRGTSYLQQERDSARLPRDRPSPPKGDIGMRFYLQYITKV